MKIEGRIAIKVFHNEKNNYSIYKMKMGTEYVTIVGEMQDVEIGDSVELEGEYVSHKVYGKQFSYTSICKLMPNDEESLAIYMADNIKGLGIKTAKRIVLNYGNDTIDTIKYRFEELIDIKGMNFEKAQNLHDFFITEYEKWNVISFLSKFNISINLANKIYEILKDETIKVINENPYYILKFIKGITFKDADIIGKSQGIDKSNNNRICAGVLFCLSEILEFGHTCIEKQTLIDYCSKVLEVEKDVIIGAIISLLMEEEIYTVVIDEVEHIISKPFYLAEKNITEIIKEMTRYRVREVNFDKEIEDTSEKFSLILSEKQKEAISSSLNQNISIITGGPGTGKTTIIKCIIDILKNEKKEYILTAPTGRAAKKITETTGVEAKTIHRLLEINKISDNDMLAFLDYKVKYLETDYLIIDETSMIDTLLMNNLLKAINEKTKIVLVGDVNQLPSVGAGNVLSDLINSEKIHTTFLTQIYRQSKESEIIVNAHKINNGEYPVFTNKDTDMFFVKTDSIEETIHEISTLVEFRIKEFKKDININTDLQIISPTKKTDLGTHELNKVVQDILNKENDIYGSKHGKFRVNDKVMQMMNNYDKELIYKGDVVGYGVYNGDIGYIIDIDTFEETITVEFDKKEVRYNFDELEQLELAYAITVHKSQGSEYKVVILPLYIGYKKLFTRNLLYTAITRAKDMLIIIGNDKLLNFMVDNIEEKERKTGLLNNLNKI